MVRPAKSWKPSFVSWLQVSLLMSTVIFSSARADARPADSIAAITNANLVMNFSPAGVCPCLADKISFDEIDKQRKRRPRSLRLRLDHQIFQYYPRGPRHIRAAKKPLLAAREIPRNPLPSVCRKTSSRS